MLQLQPKFEQLLNIALQARIVKSDCDSIIPRAPASTIARLNRVIANKAIPKKNQTKANEEMGQGKNS